MLHHECQSLFYKNPKHCIKHGSANPPSVLHHEPPRLPESWCVILYICIYGKHVYIYIYVYTCVYKKLHNTHRTQNSAYTHKHKHTCTHPEHIYTRTHTHDTHKHTPTHIMIVMIGEGGSAEYAQTFCIYYMMCGLAWTCRGPNLLGHAKGQACMDTKGAKLALTSSSLEKQKAKLAWTCNLTDFHGHTKSQACMDALKAKLA